MILPALLAFVQIGVVSPQSVDAAVEINAGIRQAIKDRKREYVVPAGSYTIQTQIRIPDGTSGFTLSGYGVKLVSSKPVAYAIGLGVSPVLHNNWGVTNQKNFPVGEVKDGATTLPLPKDAAVKAGDYLALWDSSYVEHVKYPGGDRNMNHAELTRAKAVEKGSIVLDRPTAREYLKDAKIALVSGLVLNRLTVQGFEFDAKIQGTNDRNNGIVSVGLSENVRLKDLTVRDVSTRSVLVNWCRDVSIETVSTLGGANPQNPGSGYGITVCRSRDFLVSNCLSDETRHAFVCHNGATDGRFVNDQALGENGNFDTHGCDERRITIESCRGTGSVNFGSGAWQGGGRDFDVRWSEFGGAYHDAPKVTGVRFLGTSLYGISPDGGTGTVLFSFCRFPNIPPQGLLYEGQSFGKYVFDRCSFATQTGSWGSFLTVKKIGGEIEIRDSEIAVNFGGGYVPIYVSAPGFGLTMTGTRLVNSEGTKPFAVQIEAPAKGKFDLSGNEYRAPKAKAPTFLSDSTKAAKVSNNVAVAG